MPVAANRVGDVATITITVNVADLLRPTPQPAATLRKQALERADAELRDCIDILAVPDAQLDARVTTATASAQADVTRLKARRMTGNL